MNTEKIRIEAPDSPEGRTGVARAAEILQNGGLVAIPTETVYGLAASAFCPEAVKRIFAAKGRPADNPLIVHISDMSMLEGLVRSFPAPAKRLAKAYWPGPLTMILPKGARVPDAVSAGLDTVAVRFPEDPVAAAVIRESRLPLAAPSANRSGSPSPTTAQHVVDDMDGRIEAIILSHDCTVGVESTVLSLAGERPRLLRPGAVTVEMIEAVIGPIEVDDAVLHRLAEGATAASPGMKYKHYAPNTHVILVEGDREAYINYVRRHTGEGVAALCFAEDAAQLSCPCVPYGGADDPAGQARALFDGLRRLDQIGAVTAYAHAPEKTGVSLAVYNRLIRAAGFEVVRV